MTKTIQDLRFKFNKKIEILKRTQAEMEIEIKKKKPSITHWENSGKAYK